MKIAWKKLRMKIDAYLFNAEPRRYSDGMFSIDSTSFTVVSIAST